MVSCFPALPIFLFHAHVCTLVEQRAWCGLKMSSDVLTLRVFLRSVLFLRVLHTHCHRIYLLPLLTCLAFITRLDTFQPHGVICYQLIQRQARTVCCSQMFSCFSAELSTVLRVLENCGTLDLVQLMVQKSWNQQPQKTLLFLFYFLSEGGGNKPVCVKVTSVTPAGQTFVLHVCSLLVSSHFVQ